MGVSPIYAQQERELQIEELSRRILNSVRNELTVNLDYFALAFGSLPMVGGIPSPAGTDGGVFYFSPEGILRLYERGRAWCVRLYLHTVTHCLLGHPFSAKDRDPALWDLACDIACESLIDGLALKCAHTGTSAYRISVSARLEKELPVLTAEGIYLRLKDMHLASEELSRMRSAYALDSHVLWEQRKPPSAKSPSPNRERWEEIRDRMQTQLELFGRQASRERGRLSETLRMQQRSRYDYREFLRKFMVLREETQVDPDSFDYIFYHYGMSLYGNMPLIEPLETREILGIEEFVIVIDTSMSTNGDLVKRFLRETYAVLTEEESYFKRIRIHILQCDERVRSDVRIGSREELAQYMNRFTVCGGGGTDFRPAFEYVAGMLQKKEFHRLKGLLYFTDGYGIFPAKKPVYETAFVFIRKHYQDADVPPWAIKLVLEEAELKTE